MSIFLCQYIDISSLYEHSPLVQNIDRTYMILNELEIRQQLGNLPDWMTNGQALVASYKFKDFIEAMAFVNKLIEPSEKSGHHPDISISYNRVTIHLTTHDAGGITQKDVDLAHEITKIHKE
ncbi:4a-hydroxytetrahydrobiopterin dehydratase [Geminocystis herdmanii]|uniref:4a-hydroxytetrahydrobiopterin dehydratase n=1 Tax=Geminocystis herdmanii TaxID=669359 RepID=UPI000346567B|nr:4a-hydroxytetrahydrobiopterin dehydratase [Geminocystis herdmanii]